MRGDKGKGNRNAPCESAVEDEGQESLAARTKREICCMCEGIDRHCAGNDEEHRSRELAGGFACLIELRDQIRAKRKCGAHDEAGGNREGEELPYGRLCFLYFVCTEVLTEDDGYRASHREAHDVEEIEHC